MELRITTGSVKNKKLVCPDIEGYRAVQEIAKLAMFSIIGDKINDSVCLDLFAGSGNLGLEALSRGASWCDFVDENPEAVIVIKKNLTFCGFEEKSAVFLRKAVKYVTGNQNKYDLVFMDPFYKDLAQIHLLKTLPNNLKEGGSIFYYHSTGNDIKPMLISTVLEVVDERTFGDSTFSILKKKGGC